MNRRTPKMLGVVTEWLFMGDTLCAFIPIAPEYNKTQTHCKRFVPNGKQFLALHGGWCGVKRYPHTVYESLSARKKIRNYFPETLW